MTSSPLIERLAERCEKAAAPDRELDVAAHEAMGRPFVMEYWSEADTVPQRNLSHVPRYTGSIDAAMTLVPEGLVWDVDSGGPTYLASASVGTPPVGGELFNPKHSASGETPALALCAAALRAKATSND